MVDCTSKKVMYLCHLRGCPGLGLFRVVWILFGVVLGVRCLGVQVFMCFDPRRASFVFFVMAAGSMLESVETNSCDVLLSAAA